MTGGLGVSGADVSRLTTGRRFAGRSCQACARAEMERRVGWGPGTDAGAVGCRQPRSDVLFGIVFGSGQLTARERVGIDAHHAFATQIEREAGLDTRMLGTGTAWLASISNKECWPGGVVQRKGGG